MPLSIEGIVCTVDFSSFGPVVVRCGAALARRTGARLYLFHAVNDPQSAVHPTAVFSRGGDRHRRVQDARQRMGMLLTRCAVAGETVIRCGDPVEEAIAFVDTLPPSLVVSASHGISGFRRLFVGTVVERLTRQLRHPMLVVKPNPPVDMDRFEGFGNVLVGCDPQGHWQRSAAVIAQVQHGAECRIHLVHVMEEPMDEPLADSNGAPYTQVQQAQQERLRRRLHDQARRLFSPGVQLSVAVTHGDPQEMVLHSARRRAAQLIVVGVHRSGKMGRWIAGSTTEALLRHATGCVLTIPEGERAPHRRGGGS